VKTAILCNTKIDGGGEQSAQWLADKIKCPLVSLTTNEWRSCKAKKQIWYMNNSIYKMLDERDDFRKVLSYANEIYIILNFVLGGFHKQMWVEEYPVKKVFFLNEEKRLEYIEKRCGEQRNLPTVVLPPPVNINKFLGIQRDYRRENLTIGRHSRISLKYPKEPVPMYEHLYEKTDVDFAFMIPHPKIVKRFPNDKRFLYYQYNQIPVEDFLGSIDIYLSIINPKTREQGPRTLIEAMASGLPCVVENRNGMKDRMIDGLTGYLVNSEEETIERAIELVNYKEKRIKMGQAARMIAATFRPERWLEELNVCIG